MSIHALHCGVLAALVFGQERTPIAPTPPPSGSIAGRILHPDGSPVQNAPVVLRADLSARLLELPNLRNAFEPPTLSLPARRTTTDAAGAFALDGIDAEHQMLLEVDAGSSGVQSKPLDPEDRVPGALFPGDWELSAVRALAGVVVDADTGSPIADARIRLRQGLLFAGEIDPERLAAGGGLLHRAKGGEAVWVPPSWLTRLLHEGAALAERELQSTTRTSSDGSFGLPTLTHSLGDVALEIEAPGRPGITIQVDVSTEDEHASAGTIRLQKGIATRIRVVDAKRSPVRGAQVLLGRGHEIAFVPEDGSEEEKAEAEKSSAFEILPVPLAPAGSTDASGEFEAVLLRTGPVWIAVRAPDRADWTTAHLTERKELVEIVLPAPRSLDVHLIGADGARLDGEVVILPVGGTGPCASLDAYLPILAPGPLAPGIVRTTSGSARIAGLGGGQHFLLARAPGHALATATVTPSLPIEAVTIHLQPLRTRSIRVLGFGEGAERPLLGAEVKWSSDSPEESGVLPDRGKAQTDAQGRVEILVPLGCSLDIEVSHPEFASRTLEMSSSDAEATVVLRPAGSLTGRILRSGKALGATLEVSLEREHSEGEFVPEIQAFTERPEGRFRFRNLAPGSYRLSLSGGNELREQGIEFKELRRAARTVVVGEGENVEIEIDLAGSVDPEAARISGTVQIGGAQPPLQVWLDCPKHAKEDVRYRSRGVDREGGFDLGPVPPGPCVLRVRIDIPGKGYADLAERKLDLEPRQRATVDFQLELGGPVRGVVRSRAMGEPIEGAGVRLCARTSEASSDPKAWRFAVSQPTSADGGFSWSAVPAGTHWLRVLAPDHVPHYARVDFRSGVPVDLGEIVLDQGPQVAGRVIHPAPSAPGCLLFDFETPPDDRPPRFWMTFDAAHARVAEESGAFSTRELRPGRYRIRLEDDEGDVLSFRPIPVEVGPGGLSGLELRFEPE